MSQKSLILKGTALLTGGSALSQVLRFVRNVVVARALTPEDFGVAATFWITTGFLMSMTGIGLEKMLVQDKDGDDDHFGAVAQLVLFLRGALIGGVILLLAYPIASAFKIPEATWAFRLLAVVPLMDGLKHRDLLRLQRHMRFGPFMLSQFIPDVVITALAWPIARWAGDYTAFLYIAILHGFVSLVTSHLVVERRFKLAWDKQVFSRIFQFGWPLLINNFLIFTMFQGDRIILARAYTKAELGVYSVALSLATTIPTLLGGVFSQVMLPYFSKLQNDRIQLEIKLYFAGMLMALFSALLGIGLVIAGPMLVTVIYSSKYILAGSVIGWLGIMHTLRMIRQVPTMAAIALGDTFNALFANIFRQSGLVLALIVAMLDYSLVWIAIAGVIGEAISVIAIALSIKKRLSISLSLWHKPLIYFGLSTGCAVLLMKFTAIETSLIYTIISLCLMEMLIIGIWLSTDRTLREELLSLVTKRSEKTISEPVVK